MLGREHAWYAGRCTMLGIPSWVYARVYIPGYTTVLPCSLPTTVPPVSLSSLYRARAWCYRTVHCWRTSYRRCLLPTLVTPSLLFVLGMFNMAVCAPWGVHPVLNVAKTVRHDAHCWSGMSAMCASSLAVMNGRSTYIGVYMGIVHSSQPLFPVITTYERCYFRSSLLNHGPWAGVLDHSWQTVIFPSNSGIYTFLPVLRDIAQP